MPVSYTHLFCRAANRKNQQTADSDIVEIKVYPEPTPTIRWETAIPELSEEDVAYLKTKYSDGKLPDYAKGEDGKYYGYYDRQNDADPAMITAVAESPAEDGTMPVSYTHLDVYKRQSHVSEESLQFFRNLALRTIDC